MNRKTDQQVVNKITNILNELPGAVEHINEAELVQAYINKKSRQLVTN